MCGSSIAIVTALLLVVFAMLSVVVLSTSFSVSHPTINNTWIDGGANTMCVDNATGLMGPRLGIYFHFWEPHPGHITTSDDCKLACSKAPGCIATNHVLCVNTWCDPNTFVCLYQFDSIDSCMASTVASHPAANQPASTATECWTGGPGLAAMSSGTEAVTPGNLAVPPQVGVVHSYKARNYTQDGFVTHCYYLQLPPMPEDKCSAAASAAATATLNTSRWASIAAMLEGVNLAQYAAQLSDEGYDDIASLTGLLQIDPSGKRLVDELTRAGVKKGHAVKVTNSFFATK